MLGLEGVPAWQNLLRFPPLGITSETCTRVSCWFRLSTHLQFLEVCSRWQGEEIACSQDRCGVQGRRTVLSSSIPNFPPLCAPLKIPRFLNRMGCLRCLLIDRGSQRGIAKACRLAL